MFTKTTIKHMALYKCKKDNTVVTTHMRESNCTMKNLNEHHNGHKETTYNILLPMCNTIMATLSTYAHVRCSMSPIRYNLKAHRNGDTN